MQKMELKKAIITGATGAIGKAIARQIAATGEYEVIIVGRNPTKSENTVTEIREKTSNDHVSFRIADLALKSSIEKLASGWSGPLHVLVNNAAECPRQRRVTSEGIEVQFATNVLAYVWITRAFLPFLKEAKAARIVNVASYWAGGLDLQDLEFRKRLYDNDSAYRQSKQANRMLTVAYAERLKDLGITVNTCHPGDVNSALSNSLGFGGHETPDQGARTPAWLATSSEVSGQTGKFYANMHEATCKFASDRKGIQKLFEICEQY
jgi:NAD(P)-dependent dehydrogenase (short-subunit alcohol dehydrogenase family)